MSFFLDLFKTQDAQKANLENQNKHELVLQHLQKKRQHHKLGGY